MIIMIHILIKIMWAVLITIQLPVLVLTVIVVPRQMMKDFQHNQKGKKTLRKHGGRLGLGGHLPVQGGIFGLDRGKPGNDNGRDSGQVSHPGGQVAQRGARDGRQAYRAGHGACHGGRGGRARVHSQVRLLAESGNPPEQWVWENVEAEYVDEINESDCFSFAETEGLHIRMRDNANILDYLELYLTDEILEHIVHETNRFANDFITQYPDIAKNTYIGKWIDVTVPKNS